MVGTHANPGYIIMCLSCFAKYKAMSKMRNELFEKAGEALAIGHVATCPIS